MEEIVSRDFIVDDDSDVIINVVDAANLERNLYLTVQMMELGANLVMALNMNDFAKKKDHIIDINLMSELLGFPVIEVNAKTGDGFEELLNAVEKQSKNPIDTSKKLSYGNDIKGIQYLSVDQIRCCFKIHVGPDALHYFNKLFHRSLLN